MRRSTPEQHGEALTHAGQRDMGVSQNHGYLFGSPYNLDYSILGSILGSHYFGKLPLFLLFSLDLLAERKSSVFLSAA